MGKNRIVQPSSARLSWPWRLLVFSTLAALCACGNPKDVLTPVADTSPSSPKVDMLIATMRSRSLVPGEMFTGERALAPAFANLTVSIPPGKVRKEGEVEWPKRLPANPATDFATLKANYLDAA